MAFSTLPLGTGIPCMFMMILITVSQESLKLGVDLKLGSADIPLNPDWFINRDPYFSL